MLFSPYVSQHEGGLVKTGTEIDTNTRKAFGLEMWWACYIICSLSSVFKEQSGHFEIMLLAE